MSQRNLVAILGVAVVILLGTTIYFATINNASQPVAPVPKVVQQPTPTPAAQQPTQQTTSVDTSKVYSSQKYGFGFQYPKELTITSGYSNENRVIISDEDGGHWIYEVKIENNSDKLTLEKIIAKEVASKNKIVNDIIIDGVPAKRYSISNYGDYGNAGVILIVGNNILTIYGDDSDITNKADFETLFSTFKFTK